MVLKSKTILYMFFLILLIFNVSAAGLSINSPREADYYTTGVVDLDVNHSGASYDNCYYYFDYSPTPRPIECWDTGERVLMPRDGNWTLFVVFNSSLAEISGNSTFVTDRCIDSSKGVMLFGLMMLPFIIIMIFLGIGNLIKDKNIPIFAQPHKPLIYILITLCMTLVFQAFRVNMYITENYIINSNLVNIIDIRMYGWIYFLIVMYFFVYFVKALMLGMQKSEKEALQY